MPPEELVFKKKKIAYSNCTPILFTDFKSQNNFNLKKSHMYFEMTTFHFLTVR